MTEDMQAHDPIEGEYTDAELPLDAQVPKEANVGDDIDDANEDWDDDDLVVEDVEVESVEYVDPDRPDRTQL
ncbi:MAG TPA: hypothetical protein VKA62_10595 [Agromyces sp.]|nr:hypothetical protein [Agromyces sp.]